MLEAEITIDRPPDLVWAYFTRADQWASWWGGGVKSVQWRAGGTLAWEVGRPSRIQTYIPGRLVAIEGQLIDTTFAFVPKKGAGTLVRVRQSDPKGGASFSDGGKSTRAQLRSALEQLKARVEAEAGAAPQKKWWAFWQGQPVGPPDPARAQAEIERLIKALGDKANWKVTRPAALTLGLMGATEAVEPLIAALQDKAARFDFIEVVAALGQIGDTRAVEPLVAAFTDPSSPRRIALVEALSRIGEPAIGPLIAALKDERAAIRAGAAWALGEFRDSRAVEPLIAALGDPDYSVRLYSAASLHKAGDARAVQPLIVALNDEHEYVRGTAAEGLGDLCGPRGDRDLAALAVEPLIAALADSYFGVREHAARALAKLGDQRALAPLEALQGDESRAVREAAIAAAGMLRAGQQPDLAGGQP